MVLQKFITVRKVVFAILLLPFVIITVLYAKEPYIDDAMLAAVEKKYNPFAKKRFIYLQKTLDSLEGKDDLAKLNGVNQFYNDVRYGTDIKTYGQSDYWATPWEFLAKDAGDCEDYVIAKHHALLHLGVDPKKLFFTYVRSTKFKEPHMVLTYFETPRSEPLILDNNNLRIFPASKRPDLIPIYNFNGVSLHRAASVGTGDKIEENKSHKKWDELQKNIKRKKI